MSNGAHENYNNYMQLSRVNIVLYIVINERSPELKAKLSCHIFDVFGFKVRRGVVRRFWKGNFHYSMLRNIILRKMCDFEVKFQGNDPVFYIFDAFLSI